MIPGWPRHQHGARPIRVMRIITRLAVGGPAYQAIMLTYRLQGPDFDAALVTGGAGPREGSMEPLAAVCGISPTHIPSLGREISATSDGWTVSRLYQEMCRFRPDIVHTHLAKAGAVGRLAAQLARVPVVIHTYHGHVFHSYFSRPKTELFLRIERMLARWTDRIVVLSASQEREILSFGVGRPEQMVQIPLGMDLEPFLHAQEQRGKVRGELGIDRGTPLVGIVARLVPIKAHDVFLEAARRVALARPGTQFLIVGDGELRAQLEQQALSLGFEVVSCQTDEPLHFREPAPACSLAPSAVHFLGFRFDLEAIYADLDVVVLCSRNEGLPLTIIEALAAARPVAATDVGAVRDLVVPGRTGRLVPPGDPAQLADAVLAQLEDPESAEAMGRLGRQRVHPHLSIDRLERDIRHLYRHLTEIKGHAGRRLTSGVRGYGSHFPA